MDYFPKKKTECKLVFSEDFSEVCKAVDSFNSSEFSQLIYDVMNSSEFIYEFSKFTSEIIKKKKAGEN